MQDWLYLITPFMAWLVAGVSKFAINCWREKRLAFDLIGYGGMPSNHSAIVFSMVTLIAWQEGVNSAAFGAALTLAYIVMLDANSLRQKVGLQAAQINQLNQALKREQPVLRERMGHTKVEVLAGAVTGAFTASALYYLSLLV